MTFLNMTKLLKGAPLRECAIVYYLGEGGNYTGLFFLDPSLTEITITLQ